MHCTFIWQLEDVGAEVFFFFSFGAEVLFVIGKLIFQNSLCCGSWFLSSGPGNETLEDSP